MVRQVHATQLLRSGRVDDAAAMCAEHLGDNVVRWVTWLRRFIDAGALTALLPRLPLDSPRLPAEAYETALVHLIGQVRFDTG